MQDNDKAKKKRANKKVEMPSKWVKTSIIMKVWTENGCKKSIWYLCEDMNTDER